MNKNSLVALQNHLIELIKNPASTDNDIQVYEYFIDQITAEIKYLEIDTRVSQKIELKIQKSKGE